MKNTRASWSVFVVVVTLAGCGARSGVPDADQPFGDSAVIVVVNPTVNEGNTVAVPASLSDGRDGILVDVDPGGSATTDATGLAVINEVVSGEAGLHLDDSASLPLTVVSDGDVYDLAVAYDGTTVEAFANFPIRYGVGGDVLLFDTESDPATVADALSTNGNIVFFRNGTYRGNLLITGDDVIFFGEGFTERQVVIDGSVTVRGTGVRIRGFTITGDITVPGNDFGMAFSVVQGETQILGNAVAFLRNSFCGPVTVPSSNATLLDNEGMAPLLNPLLELCE
jgi:hypothetical protein